MTCHRSHHHQTHCVIVHSLTVTGSTQLWNAIFDWFRTDEATGFWHGYWFPNEPGYEKFRLSFSDPNTAFAFKMRFC